VHKAFAKAKVDLEGKEGKKEREKRKKKDGDSGPIANGEQTRLRMAQN
jgi:hypothetical protein